MTPHTETSCCFVTNRHHFLAHLNTLPNCDRSWTNEPPRSWSRCKWRTPSCSRSVSSSHQSKNTSLWKISRTLMNSRYTLVYQHISPPQLTSENILKLASVLCTLNQYHEKQAVTLSFLKSTLVEDTCYWLNHEGAFLLPVKTERGCYFCPKPCKTVLFPLLNFLEWQWKFT